MGEGAATPTLETERFVMRELVRDDAEALFPTLSDPEQCRFLTREAFASVEELGDWLCDPVWDGRSWSAIDRETDELVARLVAMPVVPEIAEIGYITCGNRSGEGIAKECTARLVEYLFDAENHHKVTAGTDPRNLASNAILTRLGFSREGHLRDAEKTHIGWCDEYRWGLLAREWREARRGSD